MDENNRVVVLESWRPQIYSLYRFYAASSPMALAAQSDGTCPKCGKELVAITNSRYMTCGSGQAMVEAGHTGLLPRWPNFDRTAIKLRFWREIRDSGLPIARSSGKRKIATSQRSAKTGRRLYCVPYLLSDSNDDWEAGITGEGVEAWVKLLGKFYKRWFVTTHQQSPEVKT